MAVLLIASANAQIKAPTLVELNHDSLHPEIVEDLLGGGLCSHSAPRNRSQMCI